MEYLAILSDSENFMAKAVETARIGITERMEVSKKR